MKCRKINIVFRDQRAQNNIFLKKSLDFTLICDGL